jgi:hypothetical protein
MSGQWEIVEMRSVIARAWRVEGDLCEGMEEKTRDGDERLQSKPPNWEEVGGARFECDKVDCVGRQSSSASPEVGDLENGGVWKGIRWVVIEWCEREESERGRCRLLRISLLFTASHNNCIRPIQVYSHLRMNKADLLPTGVGQNLSSH